MSSVCPCTVLYTLIIHDVLRFFGHFPPLPLFVRAPPPRLYIFNSVPLVCCLASHFASFCPDRFILCLPPPLAFAGCWFFDVLVLRHASRRLTIQYPCRVVLPSSLCCHALPCICPDLFGFSTYVISPWFGVSVSYDQRTM